MTSSSENNDVCVHFGDEEEGEGFHTLPRVTEPCLVVGWVLRAPWFSPSFCCRLSCRPSLHVHKSASWSCHFSKSTCDFVRGRVGTYHEISFTAAGLDLWGPCCQSSPLSCCVGLCNTSLQPHTQTPAGWGEEWEEGGRYGSPTKAKTVSNNKTQWPNHGTIGKKPFGLSLTQPYSLYHFRRGIPMNTLLAYTWFGCDGVGSFPIISKSVYFNNMFAIV